MKTKTKRSKPLRTKIHHHVKHAVVPHKGNQYRPHLIRRFGLTVVLVSALLGQGIYNYMTNGDFAVLGRSTSTSISGLLTDTNKTRVEHGLSPLKLNKKLDQAAYNKAQDMFKNDYWAHVSPSGVQPWNWLTKSDYNYNQAGENLAKNYPTSQATVQAWLNSPEHRANLLGKDYTEVGFAVADGSLDGSDSNLVVAFYGQPASAPSVLGKANTPASGHSFVAPQHAAFNPIANLGSAAQSLSPATIGAVIVLGFTAFVALLSYSFRRKLPKNIHHSWQAHHGLFVAVGLLLVGAVFVAATGGGQV